MCIKCDPLSCRPHHRAFAPCFPTPWMLNARVRAPLSSPHEYYAASYWAQKGRGAREQRRPKKKKKERQKKKTKKQTQQSSPHEYFAASFWAQKGGLALALGRLTELHVTRRVCSSPK